MTTTLITGQKSVAALMSMCLITGMALFVAGCRTPKPTPDSVFGGGSEKLFAHRWTLTEADGQAVVPTGVENEAHLLFFPQNRMSGSTGCNRLTGTFELSGGNRIRFSPLGTTRMACPDAGAEARFVKAMGTVDTYSVTDSVLLFRTGQAVVARFNAAPAKPEK